MATTSLWHIEGRLKDLIDYVENPEKTASKTPELQDLYNVFSYVQRPEATQAGEYVRQLCRGIHPKPKPPDVFWRLMDELYKAHSDLKECAKYEPSALELCTEIERLVLDLQEAI